MPDPIPDPNPVPNPTLDIPPPTTEGQMLVARLNTGTEQLEWAILEPPSVADDQMLRFGTGGPYWQNQALAKKKSIARK